MTTDRELLELAAKAVGYVGCWDGVQLIMCVGEPGSYQKKYWNPLTDDGDALRLAVKCHIDIRHFMYEQSRMDCLVDRLGRGFRESFTDDPCAATRRAIVRAAAEIGRAMP